MIEKRVLKLTMYLGLQVYSNFDLNLLLYIAIQLGGLRIYDDNCCKKKYQFDVTQIKNENNAYHRTF